MLETAILITGYIGVTAFVGFVAYIVNCAMNQFSDVEFLTMCRAVVAKNG